MPCAQQIYLAYASLRDHGTRELQVAPRSRIGLRKAATARVARAEDAMAALAPLVEEQAQTLAAELQGYVDRDLSRWRPA